MKCSRTAVKGAECLHILKGKLSQNEHGITGNALEEEGKSPDVFLPAHMKHENLGALTAQ